MNHNHFIVKPGAKIKLKDFDSSYTGKFNSREEATTKLEKDVARLRKYQDILYAQNTYALLIIFQAMDAAGKDSAIKHVMSGVNPQGTQVFSFKAPSAEELDHVVERAVLMAQDRRLKAADLGLTSGAGESRSLEEMSLEEVERYLVQNGIHVLKFYLNVSKEKQRQRFLARIERPEKNWKFSLADAKERGHWDDYMKVYEDAFRSTSTKWAPWYVIPADNKWFTHVAVADLIIAKFRSLKLAYPTLSEQHLQELLIAKEALENEP